MSEIPPIPPFDFASWSDQPQMVPDPVVPHITPYREVGRMKLAEIVERLKKQAEEREKSVKEIGEGDKSEKTE